jgi:hypothetical protein
MRKEKAHIHLREELSKPENRINWALIAIFQLPEIKAIICQKLYLSTSVLFSPAKKFNNRRLCHIATTRF